MTRDPWPLPRPERAKILSVHTPALKRFGSIVVSSSCGDGPERSSEPGFAGLIRMIAGQQVSVQSARAIVARLEERADPLTAERFLALAEGDLKAVGFSRPKMRYGRILAEEIASGAGEHELVHSGLEETMSIASSQIREIHQRHQGKADLRTAAFINAIDKIALCYEDLGIFP